MPPRNPPKQKSRSLTPYEYMEQFGTGMATGVADQIGGLATLVSRPKESYEYLRSEFDNLIQNPEKIPQYVKDDVLEQWQKLSSGPAGAGEVFSQYLRLPGKGVPKRDIFIGKKSPSFDTTANELAQKMEKDGKSRTEIWKETGNFRGHDGQWRQEISVKDLTIDVEKLREKDPFKVKPLPQRINAFVQSLKPEGPTKILRDQVEETGASLPVQRLKEIFSPRKKPTRFGLEEIVEAPTLDKAYPGIISEITAERMPDKGKTLGYVQGNLMGLRPFNPFERENTRFGEETYDPRATLVHELQHIVQGKEGFGPGGAPEIWGGERPNNYMPPGFIEKEYYDARYRSRGDDYDQHVADVEANKRKKLAEAVYGIKSEPPAKRDKPKISSEERKKAAELVKKIREEYDPFNLYQRLSGEAEARAAARRANLTPEQRRERFPEMDFDIPFSEQLDVRSGLVRPYTSGRLAEYAQGGPVNMYNNAPQTGLASLVASPYADSDVMNVQMTPREVAGLQQLAMSYGAREEDLYDPVTGQPKFSFLKKILPMIAGTVLGPAGFGMSSFAAATTVAAVTGLVEGDLKKGLMAGLSAYSGSKIGEAFTAAGTPAAPAPATAPPPTPSLKDTGFNISTSPIDQAASGMPLSATRDLPVSSITGRAMVPFQTVTQAPALPLPDVSQSAAAPPTGFFDTMGQGVKNVFASGDVGDASRNAFMGVFDNPLSKYATLAGGLAAITPDQKPLVVPEQENIMYIPGGFNPQYGTGANQPPQLPGRYYKRTSKGLVPYNPYQMAPGVRGFATGGPVQPPDQDMNQQRVLPHQTPQFPYPNQSYPLSTVMQSNYLNHSPQPREVVSGYEPKIDPYTGEERFAEGGTTETKPDAFVEANRKYVEELNRRALNPVHNPYGMIVAGSGGLGGTNQPYTGTNPYGGPLNTMTGGNQQPAGAVDPVTGFLAAYGAQQGFNALMPYATQALGAFGIGPGALTGVTTTGLVPGTAAYNAAMAAKAGTTGAAAAGTSTAGTSTAGTSTAGTDSGIFSEARKQFTDWLGQKGFDVKLPSGPVGYATAALGVYNTAKAIEQGKEGRAALNAALTAAQFGGPIVAAAAAAIAAIGASLVNTKEYGDVALRNYWNAVDKGRGLGSAPPEELAQGFINFYRTNKNQFAGQERYGRTGNEDFVYDLTQVVNKAVETGLVPKNASAGEIYQRAVQPWLNSMGSGPQNEDARRIQDFMMTDLIHNFMQGNPISNAQVKGDKKYKIISERPVYAGIPTSAQQPPANAPAANTPATTTAGANPYAGTPQYIPRGQAGSLGGFGAPGKGFADGGAIGEDYNFGFAGGGLGSLDEYKAGGKLLDGPGDGMSDDIPAVIRGKGVQRAALADGEFVVPADVVSHLGNGSTKAGAKKLYAMMDRVRQARTGSKRQAPAVKTSRLLPA